MQRDYYDTHNLKKNAFDNSESKAFFYLCVEKNLNF